jgi:hypothetical protein
MNLLEMGLFNVTSNILSMNFNRVKKRLARNEKKIVFTNCENSENIWIPSFDKGMKIDNTHSRFLVVLETFLPYLPRCVSVHLVHRLSKLE